MEEGHIQYKSKAKQLPHAEIDEGRPADNGNDDGILDSVHYQKGKEQQQKTTTILIYSIIQLFDKLYCRITTTTFKRSKHEIAGLICHLI
jgi:hypothetical protein